MTLDALSCRAMSTRRFATRTVDVRQVAALAVGALLWLVAAGFTRVPPLALTLLHAEVQPSTTPRIVAFTGTDEDFANPERGFYVSVNAFWLRSHIQPLTARSLAEQRQRGHTLVRVYYVIDEFRRAPLSQAALDNIRTDFTAIREAGLKAIPRFTYNFPSGGIVEDYDGVEDAPLSRIRQHIQQLAPILRESSDVIAFVEAGFVGAWGEWHHSSNGLLDPNGGANERSRQILDDLLAALPPTRAVALRYPHLKQRLYGDAPLSADEAFSGNARARLGAHNDCVLRNAIGGGTYSEPGRNDAAATFIDAQKRYLSLDNRFVPQGGESCAADAEAEPYIGCAPAIEELRQGRWSTLNIDYHPDVIARWRRDGCLDRIRTHLGYRLRLVSATLPATAAAGDVFPISLDIANDGWASPFNPRLVEVVLRRLGEVEHRIPVDTDPRFWAAGETQHIDASGHLPSTLAPGTYDVLLNLPDPAPRLRERSAYSVRLANDGLWETETGFNNLRQTVEIVAPR